MEKLLNWKQVLSKEADLCGWTTLHYAAHLGNLQIVRKLLDWDRSLAYITADKDDNKTALHIATSRGHIDIMEDIMFRCPDCWEMFNSKGQNIIHIAVENEQNKVIQFILIQPYLDSLVNQKDNNGNTPLHLLAAAPTEGLLASELLLHPRAKKMAFNKEGMTPLDVLKMAFKMYGATGQRNLISKDKDEIATKEKFRAEWGEGAVKKLKKVADTNLIVATLIATVSFAAGFTLPGGYDGNAGPNQGNVVLSRRAAFKAFVIADTVAMMCSSCAVFIYFMVAGVKHRRTLIGHQSFANSLVLYAEAAMMIAFVTGLYVALVANSFRLAVIVCVIGCFFFLIYFIELKAFCSHYRSLLHW
ncbi:hypothetical protein LguiA_001255 [Lonicera macranthoides]